MLNPVLAAGDTAEKQDEQIETCALVGLTFSWTQPAYEQNKLVDDRACLKVTRE